jgi:hypothetical protein
MQRLLTWDGCSCKSSPHLDGASVADILSRVMGLLIGGAVFPTAFSITWKKQTRIGAISGCLSGLAAGIIAWLATAKQYYGVINVATTGMEYPTLAGNLAAIMTGLIVSVCVSMVKPDDFDWEITRAINAVPVTEGTAPEGFTMPKDDTSAPNETDEKESSTPSPTQSSPTPKPQNPTASTEEAAFHISIGAEDEPHKLRAAFKLAVVSATVITFIMDFLVPMPMFFSHYIFSKTFFTGWVVISFIWVFCSSFISCFLPIWETRGFFGELGRRVGRDLWAGRKRN